MPNLGNYDSLVIDTGLCIYENGQVHGGFPGEDWVIDAMLAKSLEVGLTNRAPIMVSGGRTRPNLTFLRNSEAEGMVQRLWYHALNNNLEHYHLQHFQEPGGGGKHWVQDIRTGVWIPVGKEELSLDSFHNLFLSLLACYDQFGYWPQSLHLVGLEAKEPRNRASAFGLGFTHSTFFYHPIRTGSVADAKGLTEADYRAQMYDASGQLLDPFLAAKVYADKRFDRTWPEHRAPGAYSHLIKWQYDAVFRKTNGREGGIVSFLVDQMDAIQSGKMDWRELHKPWLGVNQVSQALIAA